MALTLGAVQGNAQIGQGLRLTVPVQMSEQEAKEDVCFEADVLYGENRLGSAQISVKWDELTVGQTTRVHISTNPSVDEPVVTVELRAGCVHRTTRTYVMLAEYGLNKPVPALPVAPSTLPSAAPRIEPALEQKPQSTAHKPAPQYLSGAMESPRSIKVPKKSVQSRSQLQLSAVDLATDVDLGLKQADTLITEVNDDPKRRALAAALWRSLNMTAQDVVNAEIRAATLDTDIKSLQDATRRQQEQIQALTARLDESQAQSYANPLVFSLLFLGLVAAGGFLAQKLRNKSQKAFDPAWWQAGSELPDDSSLRPSITPTQTMRDASVSTSPSLGVPPRAGAVANAVVSQPQQDLDIRLDDLLVESNPATVSVSRDAMSSAKGSNATSTAQRVGGDADFEHSAATSMRALNTQDMADIRQKAEFFVALGRNDEAIHLLQDSLSDSEANPLIYLDLLRILYSLHRVAEFEHYRSEFNALFSGCVPEYAEFLQEGRGIDTYPEVCQGIVARWQTDDAVDYLEQCLVHTSDAGVVQTFDLAAFRDLLTLHSIARRLLGDTESKLAPFSATKDALLRAATIDPEPKVDIDLTDQASNLIDFEFADSTPKQ